MAFVKNVGNSEDGIVTAKGLEAFKPVSGFNILPTAAVQMCTLHHTDL